MSITISSRTDYSYLFQGMNSSNGKSSGLGNLNFLSDYSSIKNGSYGKLMRAYFNQDSTSSVTSIANNKISFIDAETTKRIANVQESTDKLKESADALLTTGKKSVFSGDEVSAEAYDAVSKFVDNYNTVINSVDQLGNSSVTDKATNLAISTESNSKALAKIGITIDENSNLKLDKDTFMKADLSSVKSLFQGAGSYAYRVSAQSSLINFAADTAASKANTYTQNGTFGNNMNVGNLFNTYF
ncbi:MAG: hypothetical protein ACI4EX_03975 [Lachnospiraceae bacterium]